MLFNIKYDKPIEVDLNRKKLLWVRIDKIAAEICRYMKVREKALGEKK